MKKLRLLLGVILLSAFSCIRLSAQCTLDSTYQLTGFYYGFSDPECAVAGQPYQGDITMQIQTQSQYSGSPVYVCKVTIDSIVSTSSSTSLGINAYYNNISYGYGQQITLNPSFPTQNICLHITPISTLSQSETFQVYPKLSISAQQTCATILAVIPGSALGANRDSTFDLQVVSSPLDCPALLDQYSIGHLQYENPTTGLNDTVNCGKVLFYEITGNPSAPLALVDSVSISTLSGFYWLPPSAGNNYTALYIPCDSITNEVGLFPTYFSGHAFWSDADTLGVGTANQNLFNILSDTSLLQGPATFGGTIYDGKANKSPGMPNISVFLKNTSEQILRYTKTDENGVYSFSNLPYGSYVIYPDAPGVHTTPIYANVTPQNIQFTYDFMYSAGEIAPITFGIDEYTADIAIQLVPNPAKDAVQLSFVNVKNEPVSIKIIDMQGKLVNQYKSSNAKGAVSLDIQYLPSGIYTLVVEGQSFGGHRKLVINK